MHTFRRPDLFVAQQNIIKTHIKLQDSQDNHPCFTHFYPPASGLARWRAGALAQDAEGTYKTYIGAGALPPDGFTTPADPRVQEELTDPSGRFGAPVDSDDISTTRCGFNVFSIAEFHIDHQLWILGFVRK